MNGMLLSFYTVCLLFINDLVQVQTSSSSDHVVQDNLLKNYQSVINKFKDQKEYYQSNENHKSNKKPGILSNDQDNSFIFAKPAEMSDVVTNHVQGYYYPGQIRTESNYGPFPVDYLPEYIDEKNGIVLMKPLYNSQQGQWIIHQGREPIYIVDTNEQVNSPGNPNQMPINQPGHWNVQPGSHKKPPAFPVSQGWYPYPIADKPKEPVIASNDQFYNNQDEYEEGSGYYDDDYYDDDYYDDDYYDDEYYDDDYNGDYSDADDDQDGNQRESEAKNTISPSIQVASFFTRAPTINAESTAQPFDESYGYNHYDDEYYGENEFEPDDREDEPKDKLSNQLDQTWMINSSTTTVFTTTSNV